MELLTSIDKKNRKIVLIISIISICSMILYSNTQKSSNKYYVYPSADTIECWNDLTVREKIELCRIPQQTLSNMSDEHLMQAILDYPYISEIFLYSSLEHGVDMFERICTAYAELINREHGFDTMMTALRNRLEANPATITAEIEIQNDALASLILYQKNFQNEITNSERELIKSLSNLVRNYENDKEDNLL